MTAVDISPAAALYRRARYAPDTAALHYEGRTIAAGEVARTVRQLAAGLTRIGLAKDDRVAYLGYNSPVLLEAMLAAAHLGAVFAPLNFRLAATEIRQILLNCDARVLIVEEGHRALVESVRADLPTHDYVLVDTDPACPAPEQPVPGWLPLSTLLAEPADDFVPVARHENDIAALLYTSGTTGLPKGVILTHGNIWWNAVNVDSVVDTRHNDVTLAVAPLFHIGGLNALTLRTLLRGGLVIVRRAFEPQQFLDDLIEFRVGVLFAVPAMFAAVARLPGFPTADLGALRSAIVAGAPVPPALIRDYAARGVLLQQAWGLTETAPFATYLPAELTMDKLGSAGVPMPYTKVRLVRPGTDTPVDAADLRGELCVQGPNVTPGYWKNPEATGTAFDSAGWFHTGDIAYRDQDGFYYVVDRLKDMIISGGENVYPAEVERVIIEHPDVMDVAVVGISDPRWGETVVAILSCRPGAEPTIEQIRDFAGLQLARYKLPTQLRIIDSIPRNPSGKLVKGPLREWAEKIQGTTTNVPA
ncbi:long-chain fatty acid--CoA ligase [Parafrankia sp. EUN1f]|uniref:acyl-CoA synthetase n=1 Tax=Parafrankia sp. EUN1f TaxID=102897 RepID=UPI0001C45ABA|nr:long-chain fatty acid--CoA ligase [Parafrankia sp. EUN1f]EFC81957.1 AMP-dependent synthetase and ligase [Parafrankia sp. EUN1f]